MPRPTPEFFGRVVFGYHLKDDTWRGCGNGLWYRIDGIWPQDLPYETLEEEDVTYRIASVRDLDSLGIEGASLPVPLVTPR